MSYRQHFLRYLDCYARKDIAGIAAMLAPGAVMNAINDALAPLNANVTAQPLTPQRVLRALGKV